MAIVTISSSVASGGAADSQHRPSNGDSRVTADYRMGPLVVGPANPRYFTDGNGRTILLAGSHTWNNLVDMDSVYPPRSLDFESYLDYLQAHHHNVTRLWAWEVPRPSDGERYYPGRVFASPQPWVRTGPGVDVTGLTRFDLTRFNEAYFERLRSRVLAARDRRIYVIIMLFEGWSAQFSEGRMSHPYLPANNVNRLPDIPDPREIYTLRHPEVTALQKQYVAKVLETVAAFDNVLFEIVNESGAYSTEWQYEMISFIEISEASKSIRHPIGMTFQHPDGRNQELFSSRADWISPGGGPGHYSTTPVVATGEKVVITDTDHLGGSGFNDAAWVWRSVLRGHNVLYMDPYVGADSVIRRFGSPEEVQLRSAVGLAGLVAERLELGKFRPSSTLSSTGIALIADDAAVVFVPAATTVSLDLQDYDGGFGSEWMETTTGRTLPGSDMRGGATEIIRAPFRDASILLLHRPDRPILRDMEPAARELIHAARRYASWPATVRLYLQPYRDRLGATSRGMLLALSVVFVLGFGSGVVAAAVLKGRARYGR